MALCVPGTSQSEVVNSRVWIKARVKEMLSCLFQAQISVPLGELARVSSVWECTIPVPGASKR